MNKVLYTTIFSLTLLATLISPARAQINVDGNTHTESGAMENMIEENGDHMQIKVDMGPMVGGQMLHVYIDLLAFLIMLYLVMKIGKGNIRYPIMVLGLGFLLAALIPLFVGHHLMWLIILVKSIAVVLSMIWFMGVFGLLKPAPKPTQDK